MSNLSLVMVFFSYFYFDDYWKYASVYTYANAANTLAVAQLPFFAVLLRMVLVMGMEVTEAVMMEVQVAQVVLVVVADVPHRVSI
ncbi:hypothetical protein QF028_004884 [Neobacillus sp. B4I6]|uniref:hypothetical protein n=1 Tax=Neobacillus sp. B4I6 TaxID=3373925 RepID=UPI003D2404A1